MDLRDQVAFITGGASGIGRAVASALVREGVRTIIGDLDREVEAAAAKIGAARGLRVDVTDPGEVEAAVARVRREFGGLHILGNIAGIYRKRVVDIKPLLGRVPWGLIEWRALSAAGEGSRGARGLGSLGDAGLWRPSWALG
jgi:NAD(P)-dependent dehydrogenase (short-subunit alcohol dehydrogenase family)